ncbi:CYFA0S06e02410g1_1 [Cyberlindnera fabianii]|uniref:Protein arginine N-methyltransferase n=1 Tax=Cyberlindnera fabianii TaxID=36022 RepID=A0A061AVC4_CYBFA|nr:CYFA0S06e02410g1_1 [Cyberlindnera fabianii]
MKSNDLERPYIGLKPSIGTRCTADSNSDLIQNYVQGGYDYVLIPVTNAMYREKSRSMFQQAKSSLEIKVPNPTTSDVNIFSGKHIAHTIGMLASWTELESEDELISEFSMQVLIHELEYAKFVGLKHLILAPPKNLLKLPNFSKVVNDVLHITESHQILISISLPMSEEYGKASLDPLNTWDMWNSIRTSTDYNPRLKVSLALAQNPISLTVIERWLAEPVSCLLLSSSIFIINAKGYPVLSKVNQTMLHRFHLKNPIYLLHSLDRAPENVDLSGYLQYISYIMVKNQPPLSKIEKFAINHNDVLLPPLQPLANDLDNYTYSVFEEDQIKYDLYGRAVYCALSDMSNLPQINIAIAGAGRGGLVEAAYSAVQKLGLLRKCHITAIEKNNSAVIYLQKRNSEQWDQSVSILNMDMRDWSPKESYNIIVSELLGSFGCNELSPECLASLDECLDRDNGTFIPQSYTSHLAPVFAPSLYHTLRSQNDSSAFHKQYVVKMLESCICSTKINDLWTFEHPSPPATSMRRNAISTFKIRHKTVVHGLAGFFTANLYKDIQLSIKPDCTTVDLISWFPLFFPLEQPLYLADDTELEVTMFRECRGGKVWYSWGLESFMYLVVPGDDSSEFQVRIRTNVSKIHNHGGHGYAIDERIHR